jgi:hypothetical protein
VKECPNMETKAFTEMYLGLPLAFVKLTSDTFEYIAEIARGKINGWAEKNLISYFGKEGLMKFDIDAKPTYSMSCFLLSKGPCEKLTSMMGKFWWSGNLDKISMHLDRMGESCYSKMTRRHVISRYAQIQYCIAREKSLENRYESKLSLFLGP